MAAASSRKPELKAIGYELFIGALSVLSIVNLIMLYTFTDNPDIENVILVMNTVMTPIFLGDFLFRLLTAESKGAYFWRGFGWADLLSSLPLAQAKILRLFRLWRVIRLFIKFGARNLAHQFIAQRAENALLTVVFLVLCVLEFGALAVLRVEQSAPDSNIKNASDALWWTYVSITTVGYGDRFPTTNSGRIIGLFVLTAGVGLFGTLSGFLANKFLTPPEAHDEAAVDNTVDSEEQAATATNTAVDPTVAGDDRMAQMAELWQLLATQEAATAALRRKLDEVQKAVEQATIGAPIATERTDR